MKNKILWGITLLPMVITMIALPFMSEKVPMHYDVAGNIDRWGSKYENFILPVCIIGFTLFWQLIMKYFKNRQVNGRTEKEREESKSNEKIIWWTAVGMVVLFGVMNIVILITCLAASRESMAAFSLDINRVTSLVMGVYIIFLGNFMPKSKRNAITGVRTVWSMDNDRTWAASNRYGGIIFIAAGCLIIIAAIFLSGIALIFALLGIIILAGIAAVWASYAAYKKYHT